MNEKSRRLAVKWCFFCILVDMLCSLRMKRNHAATYFEQLTWHRLSHGIQGRAKVGPQRGCSLPLVLPNLQNGKCLSTFCHCAFAWHLPQIISTANEQNCTTACTVHVLVCLVFFLLVYPPAAVFPCRSMQIAFYFSQWQKKIKKTY